MYDAVGFVITEVNNLDIHRTQKRILVRKLQQVQSRLTETPLLALQPLYEFVTLVEYARDRNRLSPDDAQFLLIYADRLAQSITYSSNIDWQIDDRYIYLTVNVTEDEYETWFTRSVTRWYWYWLHNVDVEFENGRIIVDGVIRQHRSSIPAHMEFTALAEDGELRLAVVSFEYGNFVAPQRMLDRLSDQVTFIWRRTADYLGGHAYLTNVTISESGLAFTIRLPREN